jgi:type IV pilus assembly protein PilQ
MRKLFVLALMLAVSFVSFAQEGVLSTLKFKDADIRIVLQAITQKAIKDESKVNILVAPDIKGLVTVDLENVDWQTALDAVLRTYNYGYEWVGKNIILVDTVDNLAEKRKKGAEAKVAEPVDSKVFSLNFAKVEDVKNTIQSMVSGRGRIISDARTNTLVVIDVQSNLPNIEKAIKALDEITPQVAIEAKILETDLGLTNTLGINWNIVGGASASKRPMTWPFKQDDNSKKMGKFMGTATDFLAVPTTTGATGAWSFGSLDASQLAATLEIIFNDSNTKIISMPKITTLNNQVASINVLTNYPVPNYSYNEQQGALTISGFTTINYGVTFKVTPQINKERFITLTLEPTVSDKVGEVAFSSSSTSGTVQLPILNTQSTSTKVMIKDGNTLVIAGLISDKTIDTINKVPLLGDIPLLGYFFKHKSKTVDKKNLMIFITPTIVTPERILAAAQSENTPESAQGKQK